jgi:hypothetical protein
MVTITLRLTCLCRYYSEIGIGVKPDLDEAKMWYLRAAGESFVARCAKKLERLTCVCTQHLVIEGLCSV